MSRLVDIVDTTTRDGQQSLWSATGLTAPDVLGIAPTIDRVGFHAVDFTSSTHMAVSVRFFREDPWERIRLVSAAMPNTPLSFIGSGMRFITWVPAGEDVMRLVFRCIVRNGIRRIQIVDPSNDPARLRRVAAIAREENVEEIVLGLTYSVSEVHTHAYYAERAAALADCAELDRLYLKDPGGLLTPDAVRELAPHFIALLAGAPSSCTATARSGSRPSSTWRGSGPASTCCTRPWRLWREAPPTRPQRRRFATWRPRATPTGSTWKLWPRSRSTSRRSPRRKGCRSATHRSSTRRTTTISWPAAWSRRHSGCSTSWAGPSCFRPCWRRSPVSAQRWVTRSSSPRSLSSWRRRRSGTSSTASAGQRFPTRRSATSSGTTESRRRPWLPTWPTACSLARARKSFGTSSRSASKEHEPVSAGTISDEELLLRLTMPEEQVDAMLASPPIADGGRPGGAAGRHPVVTLLREVEKRPSVQHLRVQAGDEVVEWRRAT